MNTNVAGSIEPAYEFSEDQNTVIKSLSSAMRWVGAVMLVVGALQCVAGVLSVNQGGLASLVQGAIVIVLAVFTYKAAYAFRRIVDSSGQDITHLMMALGSLRSLYRLQVILLAIAALALLISLALVAFSSLVK